MNKRRPRRKQDSPKNYKKLRYQERYHFWSDKRVSQLSFHNNILLALGFAVMSYFWSERDSVYSSLFIDFEADIDFKVVVFFVVS